MKRYQDDYGVGWHGTAFALRSKSRQERRPLDRAAAARVIAAPLPKRTSDARWPIVRPLAVGMAIVALWALAWIVAFAS